MEASDGKPKIPELRDVGEGYHLTPTKTPHSNSILRGPTEDIGDLDVELCIDPDNKSIASISAWELDDHQRELVTAGAHIRLGVWQHPIPPLSVCVEAPFCKTCGSQMVYVKASRGFFCAGACPDRDPRFGPSPVQAIEEKSPLEQAHADFTPAEDDGQ